MQLLKPSRNKEGGMKKIFDFIADHAVLLFLCSALVGAVGASLAIVVCGFIDTYMN